MLSDLRDRWYCCNLSSSRVRSRETQYTSQQHHDRPLPDFTLCVKYPLRSHGRSLEALSNIVRIASHVYSGEQTSGVSTRWAGSMLDHCNYNKHSL
jgi:hypothetical protein